MEISSPRIIYAERMADGIIVGFDDGKCALYSAALLRANFNKAKEVSEREEEEANSP